MAKDDKKKDAGKDAGEGGKDAGAADLADLAGASDPVGAALKAGQEEAARKKAADEKAKAEAGPPVAAKPRLYRVGEDCKFSVHGQIVKLHKGRLIDANHFHANWFKSAQAAGAKLVEEKG